MCFSEYCFECLLLNIADVNECAGNPCQNDGTCMDGVNEYSCSCASGYTGLNCESGITDY